MNKQNAFISTRLRDCRERCALTQAQVAAALNVDRSTYTYYETGHTQPTLDTIVKLAGIFNVPVESLLPERGTSGTLADAGAGGVNPIYQLSKAERGLVVAYRALQPEQQEELNRKIAELLRKNS